MLISTLFLLFAAHIPSIYAHAKITSPPIRSPGQDFLAKCGQTSFDSVKGDPTGHIEEQEPVTAGCELTLCRGMLFSDQPASNVQTVTPGQQMSMGVDCSIPHGGPANVTLVDTTTGGTGTVIGSILKSFTDFCPTTGSTPADQTNLQFTLPSASTIGSGCQQAGQCVVQLFWATPDGTQNYYYCVDVAMQKSAIAVPSTTGGDLTSPSTAANGASKGFTTVMSSGTGTLAAVSSKATQSISAARRNARIMWF